MHNLFSSSRSLLLGLVVFARIHGFNAPEAFGAVEISEFMARNESGLKDEDGAFADWIEIHNPGGSTVSLAGFSLSDSAANLRKWTFPDVSLDAGAYLIVFASGKNRSDSAGRLHTNFQLSSEGGYLALVAPDGVTIVSGFFYPAQSSNMSFGIGEPSGALSFFSPPTPEAPNGSGTRAGPAVSALQKNPPQPFAGPLTVSASVHSVNGAVASVRLYYRRMFAAETMVPMKDDGTGEDAVAGDGVWSTTIPADAFGLGEMTRWRFVAVDGTGTETREPAFRAVLDSPQYFGTVTRDPGLKSLLPVFHWFTSNPSGAGTTAGSRGAVYYEGEFYDNVLFNLHGQSSSGFPKKSYNIDFNQGEHFRWNTNAARVADIDLLTNWADKSKVRHVLAYEIMRAAGVGAHFAYTVRVQQNGSFFSTADFVEDADETYLERAGLNKEGALYKVYSNTLDRSAGDTATTGVEKKTRKFENNADLQALINGLAQSGTALSNYLYDNIDIARCVNMLAASSVIRNIDMHRKNWYIYRDTGRSGEWSMLPWDLDLSQGRVWNQQNTYFDNAIYTDGFVVNGTAVRLVAQLFSNPATRAMIMRRIRTLSDRFLQPPPAAGTPENDLYYERRLNEQSALIDPPSIVPSDAQRDFEKWGSWVQGGATVPYTNPNAAVETMAEAIQRFKTEYLPARRKYIYNTQIVGRGGEIPLAQTGGGPTTNYTALVANGAPAKVLVPADGNLALNWTGHPETEPFDTSNWINGPTGIGYERGTGYETLIGTDVNTAMQKNTSVYLRIEFNVTDPAAVNLLELRMKFDDGFVAFLNGVELASLYAPTSLQWNSASTASHEANPNAFVTYNVSDKKSSLRAGRNILAIQGLNESASSSDFLILPELYAGKVAPSSTVQPKINFGRIEVNPASGNQDEEYLQLLNTNSVAVDISDWQVTGGIEHQFVGGTVLPANGTLYLSPNAAAFRARAASPKGGEGLFVQGPYKGHLSNLGETLTLLDASGATNTVATYEAQPSDAQGYLVISEFLYHPAGDGLGEFIELLNTSSSIPLDLNGIHFTQGVEFSFTGSAIRTLAPSARVLVVRDLAAFTRIYGSNLPIAGVFTNGTALNNAGESLKLEDANNGTIQEFAYQDAAPWPAVGDLGYSLVLVAPETHPDPAVPIHWRASSRIGGSPGQPDDETKFPGDPQGDVDGNGQPDLIDYALGNAAGVPVVNPKFSVETDSSSGAAILRLSYPARVNAPNVELSVFFSKDLLTWEDASPYLEAISREALGNDRELVSWRVKSPLAGETQLFMRLQARLK